jgi:hypothetical protein
MLLQQPFCGEPWLWEQDRLCLPLRTKELLQGFSKVLLYMKAADDMFGLGNADRDGCAESLPRSRETRSTLGYCLNQAVLVSTERSDHKAAVRRRSRSTRIVL